MFPHRSEGNDGPWSTFDLRVGSPEQFLRVLVSTASPEVIVPLSEYGCSGAVFNNSAVPPDCAVSRGNLFNPNTSSTWVDGGLYQINNNGVGLGASLGYQQDAQWGLERIGIGLNGPALLNQSVAGVAYPAPFYLFVNLIATSICSIFARLTTSSLSGLFRGVIGLNNQPVNFTTLGNYSAPSLVTTLKEQRKIPSISWSYTAGAKYRAYLLLCAACSRAALDHDAHNSRHQA